MQKIAKNLPSEHHRTTVSGYIFATKARINSRKKTCQRAISPPHVQVYDMVNFGALVAEIDSLVCGTPGNFNRFRVLAALLHDTLVVGVSQTLRR